MPLDTFEDTLRNPELSDAFNEHLKTEFSTENLGFHKAMEDFHKLTANPLANDQMVKAKAGELYNTYVREGSAKQVNISDKQEEAVGESMAGLAQASRVDVSTMFDQAQNEIIRLMSADSFARFQKTEAYTNANKKAVEGLQAANDKVTQLEARLTQLKTAPTVGDRTKAFTTDGGMAKLIRDAEIQLESAQEQVQQRTGPVRNFARPAEKVKPDAMKVEAMSEEDLEGLMEGRGRGLPRAEVPQPIGVIAPGPEVIQPQVAPLAAHQPISPRPEPPKREPPKVPKVDNPSADGPKVEGEGVAKKMSTREALAGKVGVPQVSGPTTAVSQSATRPRR